MQIFLAEHRGFCYGVKRAIDLAVSSASQGGKTYSFGPLIHNPQMVNKLAEQGIKIADSLEGITGTVIFRSHGVGPDVYDQARQQNLKIVDATCPHVKRAQRAAAALAKAGYTVVVVGERHHPEVKSIVAWAGDNAYVVETAAEAETLPSIARLGVVAQTTLAADIFEEIIAILRTKAGELKVERTICLATQQRQQAAVALAKRVDVMIVVGGKNSANTRHLADLCRQTGCRVYHIETAQELEAEWFFGVQAAGITAGASTPDWLIEEVYQKMSELANAEMAKLEQGSIIKGRVISVKPDEVFVDIGYKAEGVIPRAELAYPMPERADMVVKVGDVIDVFIDEVESADGNVVLSKLKADRALAWDKLEQAMAEQRPVEGQVIEAVKGGLTVAVSGIRAFVPASHIDLHYEENLDQFVGQKLQFVPIEVDKERPRVVLSRRVLLQAERDRRQQELLASLQPGQVVKGTVRRLTNFGAFVDIGGVDGLIHVSDLSWERVKDPAEVLSPGQEVEAQVLKVDPAARKVSLSLKAVQRDPWLDAVADLKKSMIVPVTITRLAKFGAFAEIKKGVEGLIHISELADRHVNKVEDVVTVGQQVKAKILDIDVDNKRIALSIAQAQQDAERQAYREYMKTQHSFGVTIGEQLGHLFRRED